MTTTDNIIHVLHVDDEPNLSDLVATFLEREDDRIAVQTATDAADGWETLTAHDVDCIISDYDMPGQNGIEFLEAVREEYPDLPFILYTGKGSEEVASDAISAGVTDYLQKENGTDHYTILANRIRNAVERTRAEQERAEMRERMELALSETNSVTFEIDPETGEVSRHGAVEQFFTLPTRTIATKEQFAENAVHPEDRDRFREFFEQLQESDRDYDVFDYRTSSEIDGTRWIRGHVHHIDTDDTERIVGLAQDITDQKERKRELEQYEAYLQKSTDITTVLDESGIITYESPAVSRILGYDPGALIGRSGFDFIHPDDREEVYAEFTHLVSKPDATVTVECRFRTAEGEWRWLEVRGTNQLEHDAIEGVVTNNRDITERKEREQELERIRDIFSEAERLGKIGAWEFTVSGEVTWSDGTRRIHEVDEEFEPTIETGIEFYHPADRDTIEQAVEDVLETGESYDAVTRLITANDNERWVRTRGKLLDDGETVRGYIQDITEHKEYEQQLQEEQQFVESVFDALPDLLYTFDTEGRLIRWNERLEEISGYTNDELDGMTVAEFVPGDQTDMITEKFQQVLAEQQRITVESAFETKTGERIPYEYTGGPLEDADGTLRGVTGVGRDLTTREEREERLKALNKTAQELMAAETQEQAVEIGVNAAQEVLNLDSNAIHLDDEDGSGLVPVAVTDVGYDLVGEPPVLTEGESIAWRVYEQEEPLALDDVDDDPDVYNPDTVVESELLLPIREHGVLIAGSEQPMSFDQEDIVLGKILVGSIATALGQIERTEQLRAREQELKRQNERLEEFASVVSHDLRSPLSVAIGRLELVRTDCDSEHLDAIEQAHARMDTLIDDLLILAREGEQVSEIERVDLVTLIENCWRNVDTAEATIRTEFEGTIQADRSRLQQLVENLLRNAVDHGGENVAVTVGQLADGFYIEDDGPGIPKADQDDVFEAGYSTSEEGTGFGLNIVKEIVEAHDWEIHVTDGSGGGARFEIVGVEVTAE